MGENQNFDDKLVQDAGNLVEPRLHFEAWGEALSFDFDVGIVWANEKYQSKFFSVNQQFVKPNRALFKARGGLMGHRLSTTVKYETDSWLVIGYAKYIDLSQVENDISPLIKEEDYLLVGLGSFANSKYGNQVVFSAFFLIFFLIETSIAGGT